MSSTSKKMPGVVRSQRLITVSRGQATARSSVEARPGPQLRSILQPGTAGRGRLGPTLSEPQVGLRRPNIGGQGVSVACKSSSVLTEHDDELQKMKEEFKALKKKIVSLETDKEKDLEITRLKQELTISQKLLEIQANETKITNLAKVLPTSEPEQTVKVSEEVGCNQGSYPSFQVNPRTGTLFEAPPLFPPSSGLSTARDPPSPLNYHHEEVQVPPQLPSLAPLPRPDLGFPQFPPPVPNSEVFRFPAAPRLEASPADGSSLISYYSGGNSGTRLSDDTGVQVYRCTGTDDTGVDVDGLVYDCSVIQEQEKILKQIEEENRKKNLEETKSYELIQQLTLSESQLGPGSVSHWTQLEDYNPGTVGGDNHWEKVTKTARPPPGNKEKEKLRREQEKVWEEWEEWEERMRASEEKEKKKILKSHAESQKLRMIKEDFKTEVQGANQSPASVTPTCEETPGRSVQKAAAQRPRNNPRSQKSAEFEAVRKKAAAELRFRIEAEEREKQMKLQQMRLKREWQLARERSDNHGAPPVAARGKNKRNNRDTSD